MIHTWIIFIWRYSGIGLSRYPFKVETAGSIPASVMHHLYNYMVSIDFIWRLGQVVKLLPSQGSVTGSNPVGVMMHG